SMSIARSSARSRVTTRLPNRNSAGAAPRTSTATSRGSSMIASGSANCSRGCARARAAGSGCVRSMSGQIQESVQECEQSTCEDRGERTDGQLDDQRTVPPALAHHGPSTTGARATPDRDRGLIGLRAVPDGHTPADPDVPREAIRPDHDVPVAAREWPLADEDVLVAIGCGPLLPERHAPMVAAVGGASYAE